jgi:hypothetical protein
MSIGSHTSLVLNWTAEFQSLGLMEEYRCAYFEPAILMKRLIAIPVRDLPVRNTSLCHVDVRLSAPMSRTTHGSLGPKGRTAGGSLKAGVGPQLPLPAHDPLQTQLGPAVGGASRSIWPGAGNA